MSYQHNLSYGGSNNRLPRPSSSGTLYNEPEYEQKIKRQRLQQPTQYGYLAPIYQAQPQPYCAQAYATPQVPQPYATNQWNSRPYYQDPNQTRAVPVERQHPLQVQPSPAMPKEEVQKLDEDASDESEDEETIGVVPGGQETDGKQVITVPGTSITLQTEEDIAKWREERKKMWLLKISNNKKKHMEDMGIKEDELKGQRSHLQESKKQKQFIQSIQNQVNRINPRSTLSVKIAQRDMAQENLKLLDVIQKLGDANLLSYELTEEEKEKLFGPNDQKDRRGRANGSILHRKNPTYGTNRNAHHR